MADYAAAVKNLTGTTIPVFWVKHKPDEHSDTDDWGYGTKLKDGSQSEKFGITVESKEPGQHSSDYTDVWVVSWIDTDNNLYSTQDYEFQYNVVPQNGDYVLITITGDYVQLENYGSSEAQFGVHTYGKSQNTPSPYPD